VQEEVKWVGYRDINLLEHRQEESAAPIRIRAGAISEQRPSRDLFVSPEHCLVINGLCVPAKLLVNGGSIISERSHPPFTYYHVELERHGVLLAEDTPSESYLDTGNRPAFSNSDGPVDLFANFANGSAAQRWETDACAPLAKVPDDVDPIWRQLAQRSEQIGYPIPAVKLVTEPNLHLLVEGQVIVPISDRSDRFVFSVPAGATSVSIMSRFCIPADKMVASQRDTRRLGVRVNWIAIRTSGSETIIPADHPDLSLGWHSPERDAESLWRWTDGAGLIPWESVSEAAIVTVSCAPVDHYPVYDEDVRLVA
jgi:antigen 43